MSVDIMSEIITCPNCGQKNRVKDTSNKLPICSACWTQLEVNFTVKSNNSTPPTNKNNNVVDTKNDNDTSYIIIYCLLCLMIIGLGIARPISNKPTTLPEEKTDNIIENKEKLYPKQPINNLVKNNEISTSNSTLPVAILTNTSAKNMAQKSANIHTVIEQEKDKTVEKLKPSKEDIAQPHKLIESTAETKKVIQKFITEEKQKPQKSTNQTKEREIIDEKELIKAFKEKQQDIDKIVQEEKQKQIEQQRLEYLVTQEINKQLLEKNIATPSSTQGQVSTLQLVAQKIQYYLDPPYGSGNDTAKATITVNSKGEVIRVYVSEGENSKLNRAVKQAIYLASPLPITSDDKHYPVFSIYFVGRGNY